jgi:hypothetical protein
MGCQQRWPALAAPEQGLIGGTRLIPAPEGRPDPPRSLVKALSFEDEFTVCDGTSVM